MPESVITRKNIYYPDWHTDACVRSQETFTEKNGNKIFWCETHRQWADEVPIRIEVKFFYGDGSFISSRFKEITLATVRTIRDQFKRF